jgi:ABC-type multidrug transport system fused ATPase/permease subunit
MARQQILRLLQFLKPERPLVAAATATGFVGCCLGLIAPRFTGQLFDNLFEVTNACRLNVLEVCSASHVLPSLFMIILFSILGIVVSAAGNTMFAVTGRRIIARTRRELFHCYMSQDLAYFDSISVGEMLSRM